MARPHPAAAFMMALALLAHPLAVTLTLPLLLLGHPPRAAAEESSNCFEVAAWKINRGSVITIVEPDSTKTTGRLEFLDTREKVLLLGSVRPTGEEARSYRLDEISRIEYRAGSTHPGWLAGGFAVGACSGLAVFGTALLLSEDPNNGYGVLITLGAGLVGGAIGLIAGPFMGAASTTARTIECVPVVTSEVH
jgi:hypothetical protein